MSNKVTIGKVLKYLEQVGSTNETIKEMVQGESIEEGFTIYTLNQMSGRGQQGREWVNSPGESLALSVFLKPTFLEVSRAYGLSIAVAVAVREFLENNFNLQAKIKWPNDIYVSDKKVSGILIENQILGNSIGQSILGIGINFNQEAFPDVLSRATSIKMLTGKKQSILVHLGQLTQMLDTAYNQLQSGEIEHLSERYVTHMYGLNSQRKFIIDDEKKTAVVNGIDEAGRILLELDGDVKAFSQGEITWLWDHY